jgi:hypothetical protein
MNSCYTQSPVQVGTNLVRLLPNEPGIVNVARQQALTEQFLLPALLELEACMLEIRISLDEELRSRQPFKLGKPYPLSQCLEITKAVLRRLKTVKASGLSVGAAKGLAAMQAFQRAGGTLRQVWGDLRGEFFQNAVLLGTLYIDVANDTVVPTKPKVEILPFESAQFTPIQDYLHFRKIAQRYWKHQVYPNHVMPELAPHCPVINVAEDGMVSIPSAVNYLIDLTHARAFEPSEAVLSEEPMADELFDAISRVLWSDKYMLAKSPETGRQQALKNCQLYRKKQKHYVPFASHKIIAEVHKIKTGSIYSYIHRKETMATVTIDNVSYELDSLSSEAKAQLQSLQYVEQELQRLQAMTAALQTARNAYASALIASLPSNKAE